MTKFDDTAKSVFAPPEPVFLPVNGSGQLYPVRRIYCVGRNYLAHIRELGNDERAKFVHVGIANRSFERRFELARARLHGRGQRGTGIAQVGAEADVGDHGARSGRPRRAHRGAHGCAGRSVAAGVGGRCIAGTGVARVAAGVGITVCAAGGACTRGRLAPAATALARRGIAGLGAGRSQRGGSDAGAPIEIGAGTIRA